MMKHTLLLLLCLVGGVGSVFAQRIVGAGVGREIFVVSKDSAVVTTFTKVGDHKFEGKKEEGCNPMKNGKLDLSCLLVWHGDPDRMDYNQISIPVNLVPLMVEVGEKSDPISLSLGNNDFDAGGGSYVVFVNYINYFVKKPK